MIKLLLKIKFMIFVGLAVAGADPLTDIEIDDLSPNSRQTLIQSEWNDFINAASQENFVVRMAENREKVIIDGLSAEFRIINSPVGVSCARGVRSRRLLSQIAKTEDVLEKNRLIEEISSNGVSTFEGYTSASTDNWRGKGIVLEHQELINIAVDKFDVDANLLKAIMMLETSLRNWPSYYFESWVVNPLFSKSSSLPMNIQADRWGYLINSELDYSVPVNNIELAAVLLKSITDRVPESQQNIANIASIYNFVGAERTSCYGHLVNWVYNDQLWSP